MLGTAVTVAPGESSGQRTRTRASRGLPQHRLTLTATDLGPCWKDVLAPKPYTAEFRRDVVAVARQGGSIAQIAKDFGITESCLRNWLKKADGVDGVRPGVVAEEAAQIRELKKRNRQLEEEVEILRRAAAYFARAISPK